MARTLKLSPIREQFPNIKPMAGKEFADLKADIQAHGVTNPLVFVFKGAIVDGWARYSAVVELGLAPEKAFEFRRCPNEEAAVRLALSSNTLRRHLKPRERAAAIVSIHGLHKRRKYQRGESSLLDICGYYDITDYMLRTATNALKKATETQQKKALTKLPYRTVNKVARNVRDAKKRQEQRKDKKRRDANIALGLKDIGKRCRTHCCTCANLGKHVNGEQVDYIVTDPPYPPSALSTFTELGQFAMEHMKPAGTLFSMCSIQEMSEAMRRLEEAGLVYRYCIAYAMDSPESKKNIKQWIKIAKVNDHWKPILVYQRELHRIEAFVNDPLPSNLFKADPLPRDRKKVHPWEQSLSSMTRFIREYCEAGSLIADPFLGVGTFAIAALANGCRFVGCDKKESEVATSRKHILKWHKEQVK